MNSLVDIFISRMISISHHLKEVATVNPHMNLVVKHEKQALIRVAQQLTTSFDITTSEIEGPKELSRKIKGKMKETTSQPGIISRNMDIYFEVDNP